MTDAIVVLVSGDDWEGMYLDGVLACEGHRLSARECLEALAGKTIASVTPLGVDQRWLEARGDLPRLLKDIPRRKIR